MTKNNGQGPTGTPYNLRPRSGEQARGSQSSRENPAKPKPELPIITAEALIDLLQKGATRVTQQKN